MSNMGLNQWAERWGVSDEARRELFHILQPSLPSRWGDGAASSEAAVQASLRVDAAVSKNALWRNNNGAALTDDGRHVRFGLGNDSKRLNERWKSSDLIGVTRVVSTGAGQEFGVFTAIECKAPGWTFSGNARERAQQAFLQTVKSLGGLAGFATDRRDYERIVRP